MVKTINVAKRKKKDIDIDINNYILLKINRKNSLIEVRIIRINQDQLKGKFSENNDVVADYVGKTPEDLYYRIITDGYITNMQHAAYLGSELRKAYIALKSGVNYIQDEELEF